MSVWKAGPSRLGVTGLQRNVTDVSGGSFTGVGVGTTAAGGGAGAFGGQGRFAATGFLGGAVGSGNGTGLYFCSHFIRSATFFLVSAVSCGVVLLEVPADGTGVVQGWDCVCTGRGDGLCWAIPAVVARRRARIGSARLGFMPVS